MMRTLEFAARAEASPDPAPVARMVRPVTLRQRNRHGYIIHTVHHYASSVEFERRQGSNRGYTDLGTNQ